MDTSFRWVAAAPARGGGARSAPSPEVADVGRLARRALGRAVRAARADLVPTLSGRLLDHLGAGAAGAAVAQERWAAYDQVNVQVGLDAWLAEPGREHELVGVVGAAHHELGLAALVAAAGQQEPYGPRIGNVATTARASGPGGATRPCVVTGLYLVREGERRTALLLRGPEEGSHHEGVGLEVAVTGGDSGDAAAVAARVRALALEHNVFRGQVLTFGGDVFGGQQSLLSIHERTPLPRDALVLPAGVLEAVERQVVGVARHRERLLASGQHLKRGVLLHGPPGTGKTHTLRYLLGRSRGTTVVQLSGGALHLVAEACSVARALAPSMVVVEDVDLIAEDRGTHPGQHPLLFELLNQMDGLADDADVTFLLTTNRADLLEPALASRPGRVDLAVELGLPDAAARRTLLGLYRGALLVDDALLEQAAQRTGGVTAPFLKEVLRRSALHAADADALAGGSADGAVRVGPEHLRAALEELFDTRSAMTRAVLGAGGGEPQGFYA